MNRKPFAIVQRHCAEEDRLGKQGDMDKYACFFCSAYGGDTPMRSTRMQTDADGEKTEKAKPAGYTGNVHARIHPPSKNIYRDARTEAGIAANVHTQDSDVQKVKKYIQTPEKPTIIHYAFQVPSKVASYHQISHTSRPKLLSILCSEHHARRPGRF